MKKAFLILLVITFGTVIFSACGANAEKAEVKAEVEKCERRAFLGIFMSEITDEIREDKGYDMEAGVLVTGIIDDSPADEAGLEEEDIIISIDGVEITGPEHLADAVSERKPGDRVKIELFREGERQRITVELGEREEDVWIMDWDGDDLNKYYLKMSRMGKHLGRSIGDMFHRYRWKLSGLEVVDINGDMAEYFDVGEGDGVLVTEVHEESLAEEIGMKSGDIIIELDGEDVESVDDFNEALEESGDEFLVAVIRKGDRKEFEINLDDYEVGHKYGTGQEKELRIRIPRSDMIEIEKMKLSREFEDELKQELEQLKEKVRELKERLKKIEEKN